MYIVDKIINKCEKAAGIGEAVPPGAVRYRLCSRIMTDVGNQC